ncbi:MAG: N-acetyltransferase [Bacteroidales bacterium]|jgi:hypothetical protein|nr:N-acetyltransferase [Bacteroidales bacterium]
MDITIYEVKQKRDLKKFVRFPFKLYATCSNWVPPIIADEMSTLRKDINPAFDYCEAKYWLAYKGKEIVGRIAGIINHRAIEKFRKRSLRIGWVDFIDDYNVSEALFSAAEDWAKEKGLIETHGPLGFTDMDNEGLLVEGFENLPTIASIYNYPYYENHYVKYGYQKDEDWLQYKIDFTRPVPDKIERINKLIIERYNLKVLKFSSTKEMLGRAKEVFDVLNTSFSNLYGFVSLTDKEIDYYVKQYFSFINLEYVCLVADSNDKIIGFGISMPSLSRAMQKAKGRLFPFGFIHLLRALKKRDTIDLYLNGVLPEWQKRGVHSIYYSEMNNAYLRNKIPVGITNPQLESNAGAILAWRDYNKELYFRRRAYSKSIG